MSELDCKPCVLVVDDEPLNRELLRRVLARLYEIEEAEDAGQAMTILERRHQDIRLVLCDQLMPGECGTVLAARARERWPEVVFVLLTGYDDDPEVTRARDSKLVSAVVAKPWRSAALKDLIRDSIASH